MAWHRVVFIHQPEIRTSHEILRKDHRTEAALAIDYMNAGHVAWTMGDIQESGRPVRQVNHSQRKPRTLSGNVPERREALLKQGIQEEGHPVNAGFIITSSAPRTVSVWGVPLYYKSCPK